MRRPGWHQRFDTARLAQKKAGPRRLGGPCFRGDAQFVVDPVGGARLSAAMARGVELGGALRVFCPGTGGLVATVAQAMIPLSPATRIFLAPGATDLRKSFEGLSDLVAHQFKEDP